LVPVRQSTHRKEQISIPKNRNGEEGAKGAGGFCESILLNFGEGARVGVYANLSEEQKG
jgi:hypothetical protein